MQYLVPVLVFGILIFVHEFGHFIAAKKEGVKVEKFSLGFGPRIFGWKRGQTEYLICAIPLGGYIKLCGDNPEEFKGKRNEFLSKSVWQRGKIIFSGPLLNYVLAFLCFWLIAFVGSPELTCRVGELIEDLGAQKAGIQAEDLILAVDNQKLAVWDDLQNIIHKKVDADVVKLSILRDDKQLDVQVRVKQENIDTIWGEKKTVGLIGVKPSGEIVQIQYGFFEAFITGGKKLFSLTAMTLKSLGWMITGRLSFRESTTGMFGIYYITKEAAQMGIIPLIQIIAIVSMSLAIFNLLPLPVLDGGHLFLLVFEKIRGRRLSPKAENIVTQIGFSIIMTLVVLVSYNDLLKYGIFTKIAHWWSGK